MRETPSPVKLMLMRAALVAIMVAVFAQVCTFDFTRWDDPLNISENPRLNPPTWSGTRWFWGHTYYGLYVPVTYSAWAGLAAIGYVDSADVHGHHLNPFVYHAANLVVAIATALMTFEVLRLILKSDTAAWLGAMLYAVHPVQAEPIAWAAGLKDLLFGFFTMVALHQYLRHVMRATSGGSPSSRDRVPHLLIATIAYVLATLSKPTGMIVPLIAAALDLFVVRRPIWAVLKSLALWLVWIVPCMIWAKAAHAAEFVDAGPIYLRPLVALDTLSFYLWKLIWPMRLAFDYGRTPAAIRESGAIWWTWIAPVGLAILLFIYRRRWPLAAVGGVVFVIGLAPVLGLHPFLMQAYTTTGDHYLYVPMFGVAIAIAGLIRERHDRATFIVSGLIVAALSIVALVQTSYWRDDFTLFKRAIDVNPRSYLSHNNLGNALIESGDTDAAAEHFREAIRINPDSVNALQTLSVLAARRGDDEEATQCIERLIQIREAMPTSAWTIDGQTYATLGRMLARQKRYTDAAKYLERGIALDPNQPEAAAALREVRERLAATTTTTSPSP